MKLNFEAAKLVKDMVRAPYAWPWIVTGKQGKK